MHRRTRQVLFLVELGNCHFRPAVPAPKKLVRLLSQARFGFLARARALVRTLCAANELHGNTVCWCPANFAEEEFMNCLRKSWNLVVVALFLISAVSAWDSDAGNRSIRSSGPSLILPGAAV